jgi:hypothetical protein
MRQSSSSWSLRRSPFTKPAFIFIDSAPTKTRRELCPLFEQSDGLPHCIQVLLCRVWMASLLTSPAPRPGSYSGFPSM